MDPPNQLQDCCSHEMKAQNHWPIESFNFRHEDCITKTPAAPKIPKSKCCETVSQAIPDVSLISEHPLFSKRWPPSGPLAEQFRISLGFHSAAGCDSGFLDVSFCLPSCDF